MAGAQTGTGKTAGFTLPLLELLSRKQPTKKHPVRALILTPTRELAAQVGESVALYGKHLPFKSAIIFGGVKINPQISQLRKGVDIVIATPGRLLDHISQKTIDLRNIEFLILDEAQNSTIKEITTVLTRLGEGTRCFVLADPMQTDLKQEDKAHGFEKITKVFSDEESDHESID